MKLRGIILSDGSRLKAGGVFTLLFLFICEILFPGRLLAQNQIGINLRSACDWETQHTFADIMKTSRAWTLPDFSQTPVAMDANGWPLEDAECILFSNKKMNGTYHLSFTGRAQQAGGNIGLDFLHTAVTTGNWSYDAVSNTSSVTFTISEAGSVTAGLRFTNTSGGIRGVKVLRPLFPGSDQSYPESAFMTTYFVSAVEPFGVIRYMQFTGGMGNPAEYTWADRVPFNACSFNRGFDGFTGGGGFNGRGAPWETIIKMANELKKDAWIVVPARADDDYIRKLAQLFRFGSDENGIPYSQTTDNPFNPPLDQSLKLYVEYGNELWNNFFGSSYDAGWNFEQANTTDELNLYNYDYDGNTNYWYRGFRRTGRRAADISIIFREVFGDAQMHTGEVARVRPVFAWQFTSVTGGRQGLEYIENYYRSHIGIAKPLSYFFYGGGGAPYYKPENNADIETIWTSGDMNTGGWASAIADDARQCALFGIRYCAYEGGPDLSLLSSEITGVSAVADQRMQTAVNGHHSEWNKNGGGLFIYYSLAQDYKFGFAADVYDVNTPKMNAVKALPGSPKEDIIIGTPVAIPVNGNSYVYFNQALGTEWMGATMQMQNDYMTGYVFNAGADGEYNLIVKAYTDSDLNKLTVIVDGETKGLQNVPLVSGDLASIKLSLTKGLHGVRVLASVNSGSGSRIYLETLRLESIITGSESGLSEGSLKLYPNPAGNYVTIATGNLTSSSEMLLVYDITGRLVLPVKRLNENTITISTEKLKPGSYFVRLLSASGTIMTRMLIINR